MTTYHTILISTTSRRDLLARTRLPARCHNWGRIVVIEHPSAGKCLYFVAFSVDLAKQLPPSYWQSIQSLTNLDSTVMHGMRPFVAALTSRTKSTHASRPMHATASARFAMEIGRAVLAVAIRDPNSVSIPIDQYIGATTSAPFVIVSDASPTGMCAALYHPATGAIAAWGVSNSLTTATYERSIKETRSTSATYSRSSY